MSTSNNHDDITKFLKDLSINDFLHVGMNQIAYIKEVKSQAGHLESFAVHAADGSQLSILESYDMALASLKMSALQAVTVH